MVKVISAIPNLVRAAAFLMMAAACTQSAPPERVAARDVEAEQEQQRLREALAAIPVSAGAQDPAVTELEARFAAFYRTRPAAVAGAMAIVREERAARGKIVLDALALANTPETTAVLSTIAADASTPAGARDYALGCMDRLRGKPLWSARNSP